MRRTAFFVFVLSLSLPLLAQAYTSKPSSPHSTPDPLGDVKRMHYGGDESQMDRKTHIVTLHGNAYVIRDNEEVYADNIELDQITHFIKARGNVRYQYDEYFVRADSIDLDLVKKTGVIINGNLTNGQFEMRGSRMEQIGYQRYLIKDYDYTTCLDCPNSWEFLGGEVDMQVDGYAYIKDFVFKIKDSSVVWLPYMIASLKTKRQSGLLFPRFGSGLSGFYLVEPAFWAINDWSDMTLGGGYIVKKGLRAEWEGRYNLSERSQGYMNIYMTQDNVIPELSYRYAAKALINQELPFGIEGKLKLNEVSDSGYPINYTDDISGLYEPALSSDLFFWRSTPQVSATLSARRLRNLLYVNPIAGQTTYDANGNPTVAYNYAYNATFDDRTVQEIPRLVVNTNDQFVFGSNYAAGLEFKYDRFARGSGPFDYIDQSTHNTNCPNQGADPNCKGIIRQAQRFTVVPNLYTTVHPWPWLTVTPTVQYHGYLYNFGNASDTYNNIYANLARGYLLTQTELSVEFVKVYPTKDKSVSYQHTIKPSIVYSWIPTIQASSDHPFVSLVSNVGKPGQYFDDNDLVPYTASHNLDTYFPSLGDSVTYGITSRLHRKTRSSPTEVSSTQVLEVGANQTLDIYSLNKAINNIDGPDQQIYLSPLETSIKYTEGGFGSTTLYTFFPFINNYSSSLFGFPDGRSPHKFSEAVGWTFEHAVHNGILVFDRSLNLSVNYSKLTSPSSGYTLTANFSLNDAFMLSATVNGDLLYDQTALHPVAISSSTYGLQVQSPSRCWKMNLGLTELFSAGGSFVPTFSFGMNLTGAAYGTM